MVILLSNRGAKLNKISETTASTSCFTIEIKIYCIYSIQYIWFYLYLCSVI